MCLQRLHNTPSTDRYAPTARRKLPTAWFGLRFTWPTSPSAEALVSPEESQRSDDNTNVSLFINVSLVALLEVTSPPERAPSHLEVINSVQKGHLQRAPSGCEERLRASQAQHRSKRGKERGGGRGGKLLAQSQVHVQIKTPARCRRSTHLQTPLPWTPATTEVCRQSTPHWRRDAAVCDRKVPVFCFLCILSTSQDKMRLCAEESHLQRAPSRQLDIRGNTRTIVSFVALIISPSSPKDVYLRVRITSAYSIFLRKVGRVKRYHVIKIWRPRSLPSNRCRRVGLVRDEIFRLHAQVVTVSAPMRQCGV